jgi:hypothetical protein
MTGPSFPPSTDPEGFDRQAFHQHLQEDVRRFLDRHLRSHLRSARDSSAD